MDGLYLGAAEEAGAKPDLFVDFDQSSSSAEPASADRCDLLVIGPGRASPRAASVLADALGLPIEAIVDAIYRAPGRLLPGVPRREAERLVAMLAPLELDLAIVAAGSLPVRGALRDVAAELCDPDAADDVAIVLGRFLGLDPAAALDLLLNPPGIVLGNVTAPTVAALAALLPPGAVRLVEVEPDAARYALFAAGLTRLQAGALRGHLPPGAVMGDDGSALLLGLTRSEADALWRRLRAPEKVRLVPEQLLRFGIMLHAAPPAALVALETMVGVPAADIPELLAALPVLVETDLPLAGLEERLARYAEAGLTVTAELESFVPVVLEILNASPDALAAAGLSGKAPLATPPMPRPRARLLRHRLEAAGAEVWEVAA
jgi:hypothetical protein